METTGRKTGQPRRVPLARGPRDGASMTLISVHGRRADWVRNIEAEPKVRLRSGFRWRTGLATLTELTPHALARFNAMGRAFPLEGSPAVLVQVDLAP